VVRVALANADPNRGHEVSARLAGVTAGSVTGQVLTAGAINALNSFDRPDTVAPKPFAGAQLAGGALQVSLPAKSVVMLELR
jgi:alpha-L-arabinofuranosidase